MWLIKYAKRYELKMTEIMKIDTLEVHRYYTCTLIPQQQPSTQISTNPEPSSDQATIYP